jgi:hypothetical protein
MVRNFRAVKGCHKKCSSKFSVNHGGLGGKMAKSSGINTYVKTASHYHFFGYWFLHSKGTQSWISLGNALESGAQQGSSIGRALLLASNSFFAFNSRKAS